MRTCECAGVGRFLSEYGGSIVLWFRSWVARTPALNAFENGKSIGMRECLLFAPLVSQAPDPAFAGIDIARLGEVEPRPRHGVVET